MTQEKPMRATTKIPDPRLVAADRCFRSVVEATLRPWPDTVKPGDTPPTQRAH